MIVVEVNQAPGTEIRRLREERGLHPVDIQRISETIKLRKNCSDFGISHATLNDIETKHSVPNLRKMFSLAVCFRMPIDHILALYGAPPDEVKEYYEQSGPDETRIQVPSPAFVVQHDMQFDTRKTGPFGTDIGTWPVELELLRTRLNPSVYRYAWVGTQDNAMADLIPAGSLIEVDGEQAAIESSNWSSLRERPIFFCWTKDGYRCSWCEAVEDNVVLVPHPASEARTKRYRRPREASVIGRVTHAWVPFRAHGPRL